MYERENILRILQETKDAVLRGDVVKIRDLSNQTTNSAALTHDPDNIGAAVIIYALSKIIERVDYRRLPGWDRFYSIYIEAIEKAINSLRNKDDEGFRKNVAIIRGAIEKLSGKLRLYIQEVFRGASINKASRIYEHGISMERTANLLGITLFELASYAGEKEAADIPESRTISVKQRIKLAMEMFE